MQVDTIEKTKVIIADDHPLYLEGMVTLLENMNEVEIVGKVANGQAAINLVDKEKVDIIITDISMPEMDGITLCKHIRNIYPSTNVLILTMHGDNNVIKRALKSGAKGYVLKNSGKEELSKAISAISKGEIYISEEVKNKYMRSLMPTIKGTEEQVHITKREQEILKLIANELTMQEIAEKLFISHHTVVTHRKNLIHKLNVRNTAGLIKYAIHNNII